MAKPKKKPAHGGSALVIDLTEAERREVERAAREAAMTPEAFAKSRLLAVDPAIEAEIGAWEAASDEAIDHVDRLLE